MSIVVAVELQPSRCVLAAVRREAGHPPEIVTASSIPNDEQLADRLRAVRREWQLPQRVRLVLWPRAGDPGVVALAARPGGPVRVPGDELIRERAGVIVRAGFRIASVKLPHQVLAVLSGLRGSTNDIALLLERPGGCVALSTDGAPEAATYLFWAAPQPTADERAAALARYQFGAQLAPHVRHLLARARPPTSIFVCGGLPDLRVQIVPLIEEIEEIDYEIDVLDSDFPGGVLVAEDRAEPDLSASFQVAVAAAAH